MDDDCWFKMEYNLAKLYFRTENAVFRIAVFAVKTILRVQIFWYTYSTKLHMSPSYNFTPFKIKN